MQKYEILLLFGTVYENKILNSALFFSIYLHYSCFYWFKQIANW